MRLEDQVCSLPLAKRLKELGVKQESYFFYEWYSDKAFTLSVSEHEHGGEYIEIAAFTVAELGEMLPYEIYDQSLILTKLYSCWEIKYQVGDYPREKLLVRFVEDKEAESRAKMLIYLIENKLINLMDKEIVKNDKTP